VGTTPSPAPTPTPTPTPAPTPIPTPTPTHLLVDEGEKTLRPAEEQIKEGGVVLVGDLAAVDALLGVLVELHLEDVVVEELLEALVCEVDEELLKAVLVKALKAEDVQDADALVVGAHARGLRAEQLVYALNNPAKGALVEGLGHGVTGVLGLVRLVVAGDLLTARDVDGGGEGLEKGIRDDAELVGALDSHVVRAHNVRAVLPRKLNVARVEHAGQQGPEVRRLLGGETDNLHALHQLFVHLLAPGRGDVSDGLVVGVDEAVLAGVGQLIHFAVAVAHAREEEVEDVEVLLARSLGGWGWRGGGGHVSVWSEERRGGGR
jgi:hypothetical protein